MPGLSRFAVFALLMVGLHIPLAGGPGLRRRLAKKSTKWPGFGQSLFGYLLRLRYTVVQWKRLLSYRTFPRIRRVGTASK